MGSAPNHNLTRQSAIRMFNLIDDVNGEALGIEVDFSLPSDRLIRALRQIIGWRGKPDVIRCDNGPENFSETVRHWANEWGISGSNTSSKASFN